jgi:hypothetical protein
MQISQAATIACGLIEEAQWQCAPRLTELRLDENYFLKCLVHAASGGTLRFLPQP